MRISIAVYGNGQAVGNLAAPHSEVAMRVSDRIANGEAFDGERPVRLPRRMTRPMKRESFWRVVERIARWTWIE